LLPRPAIQITTTSPRLPRKNTTFAHPISQKPQLKHHFTANKKLQKNRKKSDGPETGFSGFEAIGLQTARKPNSVLDDHSSTRRITAAL
jgi:hypothetical protein